MISLTAHIGSASIPGDTTVAHWRNNAQGAFTMSFDDSMETHATIGVPELVKRGLVGTWFVNPALPRYLENRTVWEEFAPDNNQELADHTMNHEGAASLEEADYEIGECARTIWKLRDPADSKLLAFARGGMTEWKVSKEQIQSIKDKYHCINRTSELSCKTSDGVRAPEMIAKVDQAVAEKRWVTVHFHGIGSQWLPIDKDEFIKFLDYLAANNKIWSAGWVEAYQYKAERDNAQVEVLESSSNVIRLNLETGLDTNLYAEELTLMTRVPDDWAEVVVIQGKQSSVIQVSDGIAQFDALPDRDEIVIRPGNRF